MVKSNLARYVMEERIRQGLSRRELVDLMGYRNRAKGINRIVELERKGDIHPQNLKKVVAVLELNLEKVERLMQKDQEEYEQEFEEWATVPIRPYMVVRYMAAVYGRCELPGDIKTSAEAEEYASNYAREKGLMVCLVLSRRESVWINKKGQIYHRSEATPYTPNVPHMGLKKSNKKFLFKTQSEEGER